MAVNYFNISGGINLDGLKIISVQDVPYTVGDGVEDSDLSSLPIGSLVSDVTNGNIYFKSRNTQNNIEDYKVLSNTGLDDLFESVDFMVDEAGDGTAYTSWAATNPSATDTFLNTATGVLYVGNGTGTPDVHKTAVELTNKRIATRDANIIYKCSGSDAVQDTDNGTLSLNDKFFTHSEETDGNTAIFQWNGSNNIKVSDVDWAIATGINLSSSYAKDLDETAITVGNSIEEAIQSLDGKLSNLKTIPTTVNITSGTKTTVDTVAIPLSELNAFEYFFMINKGANVFGMGKINVAAYNSGGTVSSLNTAPYAVLNQLDVTPIINSEGSGGNVILTVTLNGYTSGTYVVRVKREKLYN